MMWRSGCAGAIFTIIKVTKTLQLARQIVDPSAHRCECRQHIARCRGNSLIGTARWQWRTRHAQICSAFVLVGIHIQQIHACCGVSHSPVPNHGARSCRTQSRLREQVATCNLHRAARMVIGHPFQSIGVNAPESPVMTQRNGTGSPACPDYRTMMILPTSRDDDVNEGFTVWAGSSFAPEGWGFGRDYPS